MNTGACMIGNAVEDLPEEKDLAVECCDTASKLIEVLERESGVLKRLAREELIEIIGHKEDLIHELDRQLKDLLKTNPREADAGSNAALRVLRERLRKIDSLNRKNAMFIQGALDFFRDLLKVFIPPSYGPGQQGALGGVHRVPTGLAIRTEA